MPHQLYEAYYCGQESMENKSVCSSNTSPTISPNTSPAYSPNNTLSVCPTYTDKFTQQTPPGKPGITLL